MIEKITIEGYKSIRELKAFELRNINILIGSNGAGKSNFISFLKLINYIYNQELQKYTKDLTDMFLYYGVKVTKKILGEISFSEWENSYKFILERRELENSFLITDYRPTFKGVYRNETTKNEKESLVKVTKEKGLDKYNVSSYLNPLLESLRYFHFHDTSYSSDLRKKSNDINDNDILKADGSNIISFLYKIQENNPKTFSRIKAVLKDVIPDFKDLEIKKDNIKEDTVILRWYDVNFSEVPFYMGDFSDGSIRFLALVTLFLQPNLPKIIIIDEPELGLHPIAIYKLSELIKSASEQKTQVIISTQSDNLVSYFEPEDIITVDKEYNQTIFKRLRKEELEDWLDGYSLGEIWKKGIIKGQI